MRTLTLARMGRALLLAAAVIMLPQLASAQLPVTTKKLTLQDSDASAGVSIEAAGTTTTSYTLTLPASLGSVGSFLYVQNTDGGLSWSSAATGDNYSPIWDQQANSGAGGIVWVDPAGDANPNWSLSGNNLTTNATYTLGFPAGDADISIKTNNTERIGILSDGTINVVGATNINASGTAATNINTGAVGVTTIGFTGGTITTIGSLGHTGTSSLTGAVTVTGDVGITGATTQTGAFDLAGAASPLELQGLPGTAGDVLVSDGPGATPEWQSIADAVGIRARDRVAIADNATSVVVAEAALVAGDIITFSIEGADAAIFGVITSRTAGTGFTVTLSGAFSEASANSGFLNYIVMKP